MKTITSEAVDLVRLGAELQAQRCGAPAPWRLSLEVCVLVAILILSAAGLIWGPPLLCCVKMSDCSDDGDRTKKLLLSGATPTQIPTGPQNYCEGDGHNSTPINKTQLQQLQMKARRRSRKNSISSVTSLHSHTENIAGGSGNKMQQLSSDGSARVETD